MTKSSIYSQTAPTAQKRIKISNQNQILAKHNVSFRVHVRHVIEFIQTYRTFDNISVLFITEWASIVQYATKNLIQICTWSDTTYPCTLRQERFHLWAVSAGAVARKVRSSFKQLLCYFLWQYFSWKCSLRGYHFFVLYAQFLLLLLLWIWKKSLHRNKCFEFKLSTARVRTFSGAAPVLRPTQIQLFEQE